MPGFIKKVNRRIQTDSRFDQSQSLFMFCDWSNRKLSGDSPLNFHHETGHELKFNNKRCGLIRD